MNLSVRRLLLPILLMGLSLPASRAAHAETVTLRFDPSATEIHYTAGGALHRIKGTFALKVGQVAFDPTTGVAQGQILVDASSGHSNDKRFDAKMQTQVIESQRYPEIFFHPEKSVGALKPGGEQHLTLIGSFNIHGGDHPLKVDTMVTTHGDKATATAEFDVPYVEWGMKDASTLLMHAKTVHISMVAHATVEGMKAASQSAGGSSKMGE
jgi:hypothetical protein